MCLFHFLFFSSLFSHLSLLVFSHRPFFLLWGHFDTGRAKYGTPSSSGDWAIWFLRFVGHFWTCPDVGTTRPSRDTGGQRSLLGILDMDFYRIHPQGLDECIKGKWKWNEKTSGSYMELMQRKQFGEGGKKRKRLIYCFHGDPGSYQCHTAAIDVDQEVPTSLSWVWRR